MFTITFNFNTNVCMFIHINQRYMKAKDLRLLQPVEDKKKLMS